MLGWAWITTDNKIAVAFRTGIHTRWLWRGTSSLSEFEDDTKSLSVLTFHILLSPLIAPLDSKTFSL